MRKGLKPYRKRKPFKRKAGGAKFMLGGGQRKDVSFDMPSMDKGVMARMSNLISLILGQKKQQGVMTTNK
jgi:hypothetical protein